MRILKFLKGKKAYIILSVVCIAFSSFGQSTLTINVDGATTVINKEVFGLLMERLGRQWDGQGAIFVGTSSTTPNTNGMRNDVINGFIECGVGAAEWPGGCASNGYDWSNNKKPSNAVGVDRFIQFCKLTGAEPIIAGKPQGTDAASNAAFAGYIIDSLQFPLKWFKIGNEVWGGCGSNYTSTYLAGYATNYNQIKPLFSKPNGANLKIIAAAGASEGNYSWISNWFSTLGTTMDALEFHDYIYYPSSISSTSPTTQNYWQIMNDVLVGDLHGHIYNNILPAMNTADAGKRVKADLDEWGDWLKNTGDGWMQQITLMDAISAGAHLNQFVQNADRMGLCCLAQGVNVIHSIININTNGVMTKTTTFYVFKLYKPHHSNNAKIAPITASNIQTVTGGGFTVPALSVAASVDDSGTVNISFTNQDLSATRQATVTLTSSKTTFSVKSADVVTGAAYTSFNDFGAAEQVNIKPLAASNYSLNGKTLSVTLPAMSVAMIRISAGPTAVQSGSFQKNSESRFSIRSGANGTILVTSLAHRKTPVTISLYGLDGRTLLDRTTKIFQADNGTCSLGTNKKGKGIYIVKIAGTDINLSKRVIVE